MAQVLAGLICGYAFALVVTPFAALALIRVRVRSEWLRTVVPPETPLVAWTVVMHGFWFLSFTAVGLVLGMLLYGLDGSHGANGVGSPNGLYTIVVVAITAIAVLPVALAVPRWRVSLLVGGFAFVLAFGWLMPYLSLLGPD